MSRIARDEVARMAELARLSLSEGETERMRAELERILDYVETLAELETRDVPPTSHPIACATPLRDDVPAEGLDPGRALRNAPEREGFAFVVPKVIAEDEA